MYDYERVFLEILHQKLKEKIRAGIVTKIYDDDIVIKIYRDQELDYTVKITDFSNKIVNGFTTDYAVYQIVSGYKKYVLNKHFY